MNGIFANHRRMGHGFRFLLPLFSTTPLFQNFHINHSFFKIFIIIPFSSFDNISRRHTSWIIRVFCIHSFSTDIYCISEYDWYWKISACSTEYSGSAGWYFRYQSIHFQITYTYRGGQFYWRKPEYPEITTELPQVTDKLYHRIWYTSPWAWVELTTSVMIGTDCICSYKSMRSRPRRPRLLLEWFVYLCLVIS